MHAIASSTFRLPVLTTILASLFATVAPLAAETDELWPQWRGPSRDGTVRSERPWPRDLASVEPRWRVELGPSYSGPIVAGDRVFVTETVDGESERVRALDRATGAELWRADWTGAMEVPFFAKRNGSWIRATPAYDGERLYVAGMREVLVALDADSGKELWRIDFPARYDTEMGPFGFVCSPLVDDGFVYVEAAQSMFKIAGASGEVVWRSETLNPDGMATGGTFSSPVLAELGGRRQLLVQTRTALKGLDPENGAVLWSQEVPHFRGMNILTPTIHGDAVFTSSYRNSSYLFRVVADGNGGFAVKKAWENPLKAYMSSPVKVDDHVYLHLGNGRFAAVDLESGERAWITEPLDGRYWSMALRGERILALASSGELLLIDASPEEFRLLDQRTVSESSETWAHLAVSGDEIFVRALDALIALRWGSSQAASPTTAETGAE